VLAELSAALGHETGIESEPDALAAIANEVSFYAGISAEEIGGRGIRWQDRAADGGGGGAPSDDTQRRPAVPTPREATSATSAGAEADGGAAPAPPPADGLLLGTYRDIWAGPVTEFNPPLHFLEPKQRIEIAPEDAERIGLSDGDEVRVRSNGTSVAARVQIHERMRPGAVFLIEGTAQDNANLLLNGAPVTVEISKEAAE
jgi:predicted molibdopterin-dependent oxidoreductase YjgC